MGASQSAFTDEELSKYEIELKSLSKKEILHAFERFKALYPSGTVTNNRDARTGRLSKTQIAELKQLRENPFRDRLCDVFSSDGSGSLSFDDFLQMMAVFSAADREDKDRKDDKIRCAFKIYDFDNDQMISAEDLEKVIRLLVGTNELSTDEIKQLTDAMMDEADVDGDKQLTLDEFQHVMLKSPDFVNLFCIHL